MSGESLQQPKAMSSIEKGELEAKVRELDPAVKRWWATAVGLSSGPEGFGMGSGVVFISQEDEVALVSITALPNHIGISSAFSHPLVLRFKEMEVEEGWDTAWDALATDDEDGELFCELWDQCSEEEKAGVKMTTDDLVDVAVAVRDGLNSTPRSAVVLWDRPGKKVLWGSVCYAD